MIVTFHSDYWDCAFCGEPFIRPSTGAPVTLSCPSCGKTRRDTNNKIQAELAELRKSDRRRPKGVGETTIAEAMDKLMATFPTWRDAIHGQEIADKLEELGARGNGCEEAVDTAIRYLRAKQWLLSAKDPEFDEHGEELPEGRYVRCRQVSYPGKMPPWCSRYGTVTPTSCQDAPANQWHPRRLR